jgi:hypothetical protein
MFFSLVPELLPFSFLLCVAPEEEEAAAAAMAMVARLAATVSTSQHMLLHTVAAASFSSFLGHCRRYV